MADFPSYAKVLFLNYGESFDPSVAVTEMERGVPKERIINTEVLMKLNITIFFERRADIASFDTWYFDTIKRVGYFNIKHPRTKQIISARFSKGYFGDLVVQRTDFGIAYRQTSIEYMR